MTISENAMLPVLPQPTGRECDYARRFRAEAEALRVAGVYVRERKTQNEMLAAARALDHVVYRLEHPPSQGIA